MNKTINCLMLKTSDNRHFFTHKNYYPQLIEFARTCNAEISVVKAQDVKIMGLGELAKSICNHGRQLDSPQYELVEVKPLSMPKIKLKIRSRKQLLNQANVISEYIRETFLKRKVVSLTDLENKFKDFGLTKATLCHHITKVKEDLTREGYSVFKVKRGQYEVDKYDEHSKAINSCFEQALDSN